MITPQNTIGTYLGPFFKEQTRIDSRSRPLQPINTKLVRRHEEVHRLGSEVRVLGAEGLGAL